VRRTSQAIELLRGYVVLMVLAFHSFIAYMAFLPPGQPAFDAPPYDWLAHPIVDSARFLGFDLFGAFQFLHLMQLMCFLSGLFVWPSLVRKGAAGFARGRLLRLGVPFVLGVYLMMPLAYYPVYRLGATDPGWPAFWSHWSALPFWPSGPLWFLAFILALNLAAAALYRIAPHATGRGLDRLSATAGAHPGRFFLGLVMISAAAYLPMAAQFPPWRWVTFGPFAFQPGFSPQYTVYFLAGLAVGARGLDRGLLGADVIAARWGRWVAGAGAAFVLWIVPTAIAQQGGGSPALNLAGEIGLVLFAACACFGSIALSLRFTTARPRPVLKSIADNAYGIYLFHYLFMLWAQYALLSTGWPAIAKGLSVFAFTVAASWALSAGLTALPLGARMMRGTQRLAMAKPDAFAETTAPRFGPPE
jgi:peptidoglycan/LPS O-acetylase OafA/YrhL